MTIGKLGRGGRSSGRSDRQNTSNRGSAAIDPEKPRRLQVKGEDHHTVVAEIAAAVDSSI